LCQSKLELWKGGAAVLIQQLDELHFDHQQKNYDLQTNSTVLTLQMHACCVTVSVMPNRFARNAVILSQMHRHARLAPR